MGAELISGILEIESDRSPDWEAAWNYIQNLPDLETLNLESTILGLGEEYNEEDDFSSEELKDMADSARKRFISSFEECFNGWSNHHRLMNKIKLSKTTILLAAGETWGDNLPQCDSIFLFEGCGAAKIAGFI